MDELSRIRMLLEEALAKITAMEGEKETDETDEGEGDMNRFFKGQQRPGAESEE